MIRYYNSNIHGRIQQINAWESGCWVAVTKPTSNELNTLLNEYHIEPEFLSAATDEEESAHLDFEDDNTLIMLDVPVKVENEDDSLEYTTTPIALIITPKNVITISTKECDVLENIAAGSQKNMYTHFKVQFCLKIIFILASRYIACLRQIDKYYNQIEKDLEKSQKNADLMRLLDLKKSLVYLLSSVKANERTVERVRLGRGIKLYEEDRDLIEDLIIELNQAIDMASNSISIINSTTEAFDGIMSNNLNQVMKVLTSITLIISIPTLISGIYGMNVDGLPIAHFLFVMAICVVVIAITFIILRKKDML